MEKYINFIKNQLKLRFPEDTIFIINGTSLNIKIKEKFIYIRIPITKILIDELQSYYGMDLKVEIIDILYNEILKKKLEK